MWNKHEYHMFSFILGVKNKQKGNLKIEVC
jgi:hypothetical protein